MFDFNEQIFNDRIEHEHHSYNFQRKSLTKQKSAIQKPSIAYDNSLISELKREHELLVEAYGSAFKNGFLRKDFKYLCNQLDEFKTLLQGHTLKENVKLFCYIEQQMKSDSDSLDLIHRFRRDINYWSNTLFNFCKKYEQPIDVFFMQDSFEKEYFVVGKALIHRIQLIESKLYSQYISNETI